MNSVKDVSTFAKTLLQIALGVALVDLFLIRALIGRVFFDPSDFIADLIYAYLVLVAYSGLHLFTGFKFGSSIIQYLTSAAHTLAIINLELMVVFYFLGQGADVMQFCFNTFVYFSAPFGFLGYALDYSLEHSQSEEGQKQAQVVPDSIMYFNMESQKNKPLAMI